MYSLHYWILLVSGKFNKGFDIFKTFSTLDSILCWTAPVIVETKSNLEYTNVLVFQHSVESLAQLLNTVGLGNHATEPICTIISHDRISGIPAGYNHFRVRVAPQ